MSLENEINRLKRAKSNIRASLKTKIGLDIPEETKLDEYAKCIDDVESTCPHINGDFYSIITKNGTDYSHLFQGCSINDFNFLSNWDTSKVTNMSYTFDECSSLTSLDLSNWDTSQVTNMERMFYYCGKLTSLNLSNLDTSNVTNMNSMFYNCYLLKSLDLSNFNTSQVTNMADMFESCSNLTSLDLSSWDTSNVTNMDSIFRSCYKLVTLNLSGWNTSKVTNMNSLFYSYYDMNIVHIFGELDLSNLTNGFNYASYADPLKGCVKLETLYLKNIYKNCKMTNASKWCINLGDTNVKDECLTYIIDQLPDLINDKKLTTTTNIVLTLPKTNLLSEEQVAVAKNKGWQVANTTYNLASYNVTYNVENIIYTEKLMVKEGMPFKLTLLPINNDYAIESVTVTMGDKTITPTYTKDDYDFITSANINITSVTGDITITAKAEEAIRQTTFTVGVADPSKNNTLKITPLENYSVKSILINGKSQTVPSITNTKSYTVNDGDEIKINGAFYLGYSTITSISNFKLQSNITNIRYMFCDCKNLTSIDLSNCNTSNVTVMAGMFRGCKSLTSLDLSNFDTSKVTSMGAMFSGCESLTSLDLSKLDASNVSSVCVPYYSQSSASGMFQNCTSLVNLSLPNNLGSVKNIDCMFENCKSLTSLDLSNLDTRGLLYNNSAPYGFVALKEVPVSIQIKIKPEILINPKTGVTFTPKELYWFNINEDGTKTYGTFTDCTAFNPLPPIDPTDPSKPLPPA